jgi:hypothetical protein
VVFTGLVVGKFVVVTGLVVGYLVGNREERRLVGRLEGTEGSREGKAVIGKKEGEGVRARVDSEGDIVIMSTVGKRVKRNTGDQVATTGGRVGCGELGLLDGKLEGVLEGYPLGKRVVGAVGREVGNSDARGSVGKCVGCTTG